MTSEEMKRAKRCLEAVQGQILPLEQRITLTVELSAHILNESHNQMSKEEEETQQQIARMIEDPQGKVFTARMTDQCFRSNSPAREASQMTFLLKRYGIPKFVNWWRQFQLATFLLLGSLLPWVFVPLAKRMLRQETAKVIIPGEVRPLLAHLKQRRREGVQINLNHLGEAILGEGEAERRLKMYLDDLARPEIDYISVKISTICSQINLLSREKTLKILEERLKMLYRAAMQHQTMRIDDTIGSKFVNLDMEEYRDLNLTVDLFCRVLDDPEFHHYYAGIVLQSYLPDSYPMLKKLTEWAQKRVKEGKSPIKIRLVKGANLAMERVDASIRNIPQAPYDDKENVDANYKKMMTYACDPVRAPAVHIGIASHNIFDIAYGLLLRAENGIEKYVSFEMLEGMVESVRRVVHELSGGMVLYCPSATEREFVSSVAYLVRRLDENTAPENFLRHIFYLKPGAVEWESQVQRFRDACLEMETVSVAPRRTQNRYDIQKRACGTSPFTNEPDTDWSLRHNVQWAEEIVEKAQRYEGVDIPIVVAGEEQKGTFASGNNPSHPESIPYRYTLADAEQVEAAITTAKQEQREWREKGAAERSEQLALAAQAFREGRADLIKAMVIDSGKTVSQADTEVSEAIDFIEYYRRNSEELLYLDDIEWRPNGTVVVAPPWNFPCAIPTGGISAALAAGNTVIFKPAPEAVLVGWTLVNLLWGAGISRKILQFITCEDETQGSTLIKDPRIDVVVLTGATSTAKKFLNMRPNLNLIAETGGKNSIIVTALADRDLAIKAIIESAFLHAGQKCSACSLAILEAEVYDDKHFQNQLVDAAKSMAVGVSDDLSTLIAPLIAPPNDPLKRGLTQLEPGERWALQPKQDLDNPCLWSPGIKWDVKEGSFTHMTELFGPVLGVMRADDLEHAVSIANATPYGLTAGLQTLDIREMRYWIKHIVAGNMYINRGITGAVVQRQPFGGCKESCFGRGSKAGGPNYLMQLMLARQKGLPHEREPTPESLEKLCRYVEKMKLTETEREYWNAAVCNYMFYWVHYFSKDHDPTLLIGQDNLLRYVPQEKVYLRLNDDDAQHEACLVIAAASICNTPLEISSSKPLSFSKYASCREESEEQFIANLSEKSRVRLLRAPSEGLRQSLAEKGCDFLIGPVLANGRIELLNYLREVAISNDYHRYGNLGRRESEERRPLPGASCEIGAGGCCGQKCAHSCENSGNR
ncbi:MAG: bifunctional proline dehydrogenase/L-glutamate gamma-semialdehyde dehydrogenase [Chlamydiales bacterium]|nr:bifunctional proline dehydrogenase/L-glutamate gamma-semialdehyde dehydrogenase [Chlamydiia bacterium]MCP5508756.1 bifunctional proline dehydrogenase/L-glutamate gamma-semialdehyde dehydrogenase [Chlamydiales bacterium]